jgi:hypothetical protein
MRRSNTSESCECHGEFDNRGETRANRDGASADRDGASANRDGANTNRVGTNANRDGANANVDGSNANRDGANANRDGTNVNRDEHTLYSASRVISGFDTTNRGVARHASRLRISYVLHDSMLGLPNLAKLITLRCVCLSEARRIQGIHREVDVARRL